MRRRTTNCRGVFIRAPQHTINDTTISRTGHYVTKIKKTGHNAFGRQITVTAGGGNCSVSDTINTLGGGPDVSKTLSTVEGNCGGITS